MSHHLDSPIARKDVRLDITDLYVFRGETGTAFVINVCPSIAGDIPIPGYHPEGRYEFKIDLNDDAIEELTYRITFDQRDLAGKQRFVLRRITGADAAEPNAAGTVVTQGATGEAVTTPAGVRIWTGKAGDPFWIEPDVARAVGHAFQDGTVVDLSTWNPARAKNAFAGQTVYSMVLEVPDKELLPDERHNHRIRVWALASLATDAGGWRPINRAGLPMIHPLFTRHNEDLGNRLNAGRPADDFETYGALFTKSIAGVVGANWNRGRPASIWGKGRTPVPSKPAAVHGRHTGGVWFRRVERPLVDRQRVRRDVLDRFEHSHWSRYRQGVGLVEALEDFPVCPGCLLVGCLKAVRSTKIKKKKFWKRAKTVASGPLRVDGPMDWQEKRR